MLALYMGNTKKSAATQKIRYWANPSPKAARKLPLQIRPTGSDNSNYGFYGIIKCQVALSHIVFTSGVLSYVI
jgi:hypothetical protein